MALLPKTRIRAGIPRFPRTVLRWRRPARHVRAEFPRTVRRTDGGIVDGRETVSDANADRREGLIDVYASSSLENRITILKRRIYRNERCSKIMQSKIVEHCGTIKKTVPARDLRLPPDPACWVFFLLNLVY